MINENDFKLIVSKNITEYRKANGLTQAELAEKLYYSDKAVSKWERGESIPDAYTLMLIADLFNISIEDLCVNHSEGVKPMSSKKWNHLFITILSVVLTWFIGVIIFSILALLPNHPDKLWLIFIDTLPVSFIVSTVFTSLWYDNLSISLNVAGLAASLCLLIYFILKQLSVNCPWIVFIILGVFEILVALWFLLKYLKKKNNQKE